MLADSNIYTCVEYLHRCQSYTTQWYDSYHRRISSNIAARGGLVGQGSVDGVVGSGTIGCVGVTTCSGRTDEKTSTSARRWRGRSLRKRLATRSSTTGNACRPSLRAQSPPCRLWQDFRRLGSIDRCCPLVSWPPPLLPPLPMPTASKRGKINKAQPVRKGLPDDPQKRNNKRRGYKRTSFRTAARKHNHNWWPQQPLLRLDIHDSSSSSSQRLLLRSSLPSSSSLRQVRRVAMTTSLSAFPTFLSGGEEGKEKTLRQTTHGIHPSLPIILPPHVLIPHYSAGDYVRCHKEDNASSPPFLWQALSPRRNDFTPPPLSRIWRLERGGRCDLCW